MSDFEIVIKRKVRAAIEQVVVEEAWPYFENDSMLEEAIDDAADAAFVTLQDWASVQEREEA